MIEMKITKHKIEGKMVCSKTGEKLTHVWNGINSNKLYASEDGATHLYVHSRMYRVTRESKGILINNSCQKKQWTVVVQLKVKRGEDKPCLVNIPVKNTKTEMLQNKKEQAYIYAYAQKENGGVIASNEGYTDKYTWSSKNANVTLSAYTTALGFDNNEIYFADGKAEIVGVNAIWRCNYINFTRFENNCLPIYTKGESGLPYLHDMAVYLERDYNQHGTQYEATLHTNLNQYSFATDKSVEFDYIELEVLV